MTLHIETRHPYCGLAILTFALSGSSLTAALVLNLEKHDNLGLPLQFRTWATTSSAKPRTAFQGFTAGPLRAGIMTLQYSLETDQAFFPPWSGESGLEQSGSGRVAWISLFPPVCLELLGARLGMVQQDSGVAHSAWRLI